MASPQLEDGHFRIANEFYDAICRIRIPGEARQVFDFVVRKTWGWKKREDQIALSQFVLGTGLKKNTVIKARRKLLEMNLIIVTQKGNDETTLYRVNKDFESWKACPKKGTYPNWVISVPQKGNASYPNWGPTKDTTTKDTITKDNPLTPKGGKSWQETFKIFWTAYPKKASKGYAERVWKRINPDEQLSALIIRGIERAKTSEKWKKQNGEFIPYPATWLNARGWEDEIEEDGISAFRREAEEEARREKVAVS